MHNYIQLFILILGACTTLACILCRGPTGCAPLAFDPFQNGWLKLKVVKIAQTQYPTQTTHILPIQTHLFNK